MFNGVFTFKLGILEVVYGYQIQDENDLYVQLADDAVLGMRESFIHGAFLVDYFPMLKNVPGELSPPLPLCLV